MHLELHLNGERVRVVTDHGSRSVHIIRESGQESIELTPNTRVTHTQRSLKIGATEFTAPADDSAGASPDDLKEFARTVRHLAAGLPVGGSAANRSAPPPESETVSSAVSAGVPSRAHDDLQTAISTAGLLVVPSFVLGFFSLVGGIIIAAQVAPECDGYRSVCDTAEKYPNIAQGIGAGVFGAMFMFSIAMIAAYVRGRSRIALGST